MRLRPTVPILLCCLLAAPAGAEDYQPPLSAYLDLSDYSEGDVEAVEDGGTPIEERIRVSEFSYEEVRSDDGERDVGAKITASLEVVEGIELSLPGLEAAFTLELGLGSLDAVITLREEETTDADANYPFAAELSASQLPLSLKLDPDFFVPVVAGTFELSQTPDDAVRVSLAQAATVTFLRTWDGELEIVLDDGSGSEPSLSADSPFMLGDSGIVIELEGLSADLSELSSAGGLSPEWRGVLLDRFTVHWTNGLDLPEAGDDGSGSADPSGLVFTDFQIGTGGFSGSITGTGLESTLGAVDLFGMDFEVSTLGVSFTHNALTGGTVGGNLRPMPFFDQDLGVTLALDMEGSFAVQLDDPGTGDRIVLGVPGVLDFHVDSVAFELTDAELLVRLSGDLEPLFFGGVDGLEATDSDGSPASELLIPIEGLTITSAGDVSMEGGWVTLPQKRYLGFQGFQVTLSQIGFGVEKGTTDQSWFGFTGGVELLEGLDAQAEFKRLQFLWPATDSKPVDVRLEGIEVAFEQLGVLRFEGAVDWFEDEGTADGVPGKEGFAGELDIGLLALGLTMEGRVVIGSAEDGGTPFKFFFIDLESQFPAGIPVFTGVSIYGLSGLFALNMSPNISAFTSPVDWFYEHLDSSNVVAGSPAPWLVQDGALAFGAGVVVGTVDNGFTVNGKVALTIAVPGPAVVLSGQANLLKPRTALSDDDDIPLFTALAVYDGASGEFLINIGVFYSLAKVIEVSGEAEAFFDLRDPGNWHLYLGQKEPEDQRITADVLSLAEAASWYMIEPDGLAFGARLEFGDRWKFGPLKVVLEAWFGYAADISWRPIQVWGEIDLGGRVELSAFGASVGLSASATLELKTPAPYYIAGEFKVKMSLPWPLPDPKATVKLKWEQKGEQEPLDNLVADLTLHSRKRDWVFRPALEDHSDTSSRSTPDTDVFNSDLCDAGKSVPDPGSTDVDVSSGCRIPMVPLDSFLSIRMDRSTNDPADLGFGNAYASAESDRHVDVVDEKSFQYDLVSYELLYEHKGSDPVAVSTAPSDLYGSWTSIPNTATTEVHNNLDLLSKNPYRYYENSTTLGYSDDESSWTDWAAEHYGAAYCLDAVKYNEHLWDGYHWQFGAPDAGGEADADGEGDPDDFLGAEPDGYAPNLSQLDCPTDLDWMEDEDFILPPYSVFRLVVDGEVLEPDASQSYRLYRSAVYFHTEGPPLDLDDYVDHQVPNNPERPYYRSYDVAVRFNENYMNKLYRESEEQFFELQILDERDNPVAGDDGSVSAITTSWEEAPDTDLSETEAAWVEVLEDLGAVSAGDLPKDDLVRGRPDDETAIRPGQRHRVLAWLEDERLATDDRLDDATWLGRHPVRHVSPDQERVVLYEYDFTASRYLSMTDLLEGFEEAGGTWFVLELDAGLDLTELASRIEVCNEPFPTTSSTVSSSDTDAIGLFLRHLLSPRGPDDFSDEKILAAVEQTPGFAAEASDLDDGELTDVRDRWSDALEAFEEVDGLLELDLERQPLPSELEILVLRRGDRAIGYLLEFPEAIDPSRIQIEASEPGVGAYDPVVVPNADNTRAFVFRVSGGQVRNLTNGTHELTFTFHRDLGGRNPRYPHRDGADTESKTLSFDVPGDRFEDP